MRNENGNSEESMWEQLEADAEANFDAVFEQTDELSVSPSAQAVPGNWSIAAGVNTVDQAPPNRELAHSRLILVP
jgi:hypothetical protein